MLKLLLLTLGFVCLSVLFLCVKLILKPGSRFGSIHIGGSKAMRERGIHCVQSMDAMERHEKSTRVSERKPALPPKESRPV